VIAHDPLVGDDVLRSFEVEGTSFDDLVGRCDFISLHAPLLPTTRGLVGTAAFARMKKGAFLINTARGPLIDETALIAALDSGQLGGAALDVVAAEPLSGA
jgi:phosphoglycerate dehydrogenase-like enzyme